jgi:hypothetical protein
MRSEDDSGSIEGSEAGIGEDSRCLRDRIYLVPRWQKRGLAGMGCIRDRSRSNSPKSGWLAIGAAADGYFE